MPLLEDDLDVDELDPALEAMMAVADATSSQLQSEIVGNDEMDEMAALEAAALAAPPQCHCQLSVSATRSQTMSSVMAVLVTSSALKTARGVASAPEVAPSLGNRFRLSLLAGALRPPASTTMPSRPLCSSRWAASSSAGEAASQ